MAQNIPIGEPGWGKPGGFIMVAAFGLMAVLMFFGLVINVGYVFLWHDRAQNAADAAALAAVKVLDQTALGLEEAREVAARLVSQNEIVEGEFEFDPALEVTFGIWEEETEIFVPTDEPLIVNAVRVEIQQSKEKGNPVPLFFSSMLKKNGVDVRLSSIANVPAGLASPISAPSFPVAVSSFSIQQVNSQVLACDREIIIGDGTRADCKTSNCVIDRDGEHYVWTTGENRISFQERDVRERSNDIVRCLKGNKRACSRATVQVSSRIGTKSGNKCGAFNNINAEFPRVLRSKRRGKTRDRGGIFVQVAVYTSLTGGDPSFFDPNASSRSSRSSSSSRRNNSSSRSSRSSSRSDSCRNNNRRNNRGRNNRGCQSSRSSSSRSSSSSRPKSEKEQFVSVEGIATLEIKSIRSTGNQQYIRAKVACDVTVPDPAIRPNNLRNNQGGRSNRQNGQRSVRQTNLPYFGTAGKGSPRLCK